MSERPPDGEARHTDDERSESAPALRKLNEEVLHPAGGRSASDYAAMFSALGHPLRLAGLYTLYKAGECTHSDLADALDVDGNGLNHHLNAVVDTPLVRKTPSDEDGRKMIYQLTPVGTRITEYVLDVMTAEREAIETEYLDPDQNA